MFLRKKPDESAIDAFLVSQAHRDFSYRHVGASGGPAPRGYAALEHRARLGTGQQAFLRGRENLRRWRQFELGWVEIRPQGAPLATGGTVAIVAHAYGLWTLSACRIVEVFDVSDASSAMFGFAYGTLDHVAAGEEQFLVGWNRDDDSVWYTIRSFSRPAHPLAWIGCPLFRRVQRRFARDSCAAMLGKS
jgi:uncharacterized protein (UPF0548 family)